MTGPKPQPPQQNSRKKHWWCRSDRLSSLHSQTSRERHDVYMGVSVHRRMELQTELDIKSLGLLNRLTKQGDFYFHLVVTVIVSIALILTDKVESLGWTIALIFLAIISLPFYTFFVHRYYIYSISQDSDKLVIKYKKWFKDIKSIIPLTELQVAKKVQYKINFETLVLCDEKIKITQSVQGEWTPEVMTKLYDKLLEITKH